MLRGAAEEGLVVVELVQDVVRSPPHVRNRRREPVHLPEILRRLDVPERSAQTAHHPRVEQVHRVHEGQPERLRHRQLLAQELAQSPGVGPLLEEEVAQVRWPVFHHAGGHAERQAVAHAPVKHLDGKRHKLRFAGAVHEESLPRHEEGHAARRPVASFAPDASLAVRTARQVADVAALQHLPRSRVGAERRRRRAPCILDVRVHAVLEEQDDQRPATHYRCHMQRRPAR
mmetsp:Transcript_40427/g.91825  ORF Transcript_40427/g.91825 Transcript_40427/m.91825 type:complete len:230 (-) Transcript_40427:90-779(-)